MHGAGTRTATTTAKPAARLLDLTRLISHAGRGPLTGVDRVEMAYLNRLLDEPEPLFALVRTRLGFVFLDHSGAKAIADRLKGVRPWGGVDMLARARLRQPLPAKRAESDLRRVALARCRKAGLGQMLARHLPPKTAYLNVGHSNLSDHVFNAVQAVQGLKSVVLVHDTIPLDHPEFQRPGTPEKFARRLRAVGRHADLVICNSAQSQQDAARHLAGWGRVPDSIVAHLGIDQPVPAHGILPAEFDPGRPYFVTVGTIEPRKNHALLLNIWAGFYAELPSGDRPQLFIAGRRGWANESVFRRLDGEPFIGRDVYELTNLDDGAVAALLEGSAGMLFPSLAEGFGLPPAEAAALGVPVVCAPLPVYGEILGNIPVYAEPNDRYSWEAIILELAEKKKAGAGAERKAETSVSLPTWEDHFNLVLKVT